MNQPIPVMMLVLDLNIGGQEQMIKELCGELHKRNYQPIVCCLGQPGDLAAEAEAEGTRVVALGKEAGFQIGLVPKIKRLLRQHHAELLHSHNSAGLVYGALASAGSALPHVHTRHGVGDQGQGRRAQLRNWLCGLTVKKLVAVSASLKHASINDDHIAPHKVSVITNGVNLDRFLDIPIPQPNSSQPVIGHIARLSKVKNQSLLLSLFSKFLVHKPGARLIIVGDGPEAENLQAQCQQLALGDRVEFTGVRRDIPNLLAQCDWIALTSLSEGTPISVIEAMAAGRPVTSTKVGGMSEIVQSGRTGYLVELDSPEPMVGDWLALTDQPGHAAELGAAGREVVRSRYASSAMADAYSSLYQGLITSN